MRIHPANSPIVLPCLAAKAASTSRRRLFTRVLLGGALLAGWAVQPACADTYPSKPITIVVPFGAGSGTDQLARIVGAALSQEAKVPVVIDNKGGASGMIAAQQVAKAKPDGYTVLMTTNTTHAANEHLYRKLPYDPVKDFTPVALLSKGHMLLLVAPNSPYKTLADLLEAARKSPGTINFGSGSSSSRVAGELLTQLAKVKMVHVPYKSNPLGITDLMGSQIDVMFADAPTALLQVTAGKLRALAASGTQRLDAVPNVPTVAEAGVTGYDMSYWTAVYLPAGAKPAVAQRLNALLAKASNAEAVVANRKATSSVPAFSAPEGLAKFQTAESQKWGRVIKAAGIVPE